MRILIDIPENKLEKLAILCHSKEISRAEAVRRAVEKYLEQYSSEDSRKVFGLWKNRKINSRQYQQKLRSEWDE